MSKKIARYKQEDNSSTKFKQPTPTVEITHFDYPIFCLKNIHPDYSLEKCSKDEKAALMEALYIRSQLTWNQLRLADRHGLGSEKIAINGIKPRIPKSVTGEVKDLLAFRYFDLKPFVGYQNKFIFHILFIDSGRNLYDHG